MAGFLENMRAIFRRNVAPNGREIIWADDVIPMIEGMTVDELWRTQPYLRTVVTFVARNIAHLGLHTYERVSDTDRRRARDNPVAMLLARPNPTTTTFELINATVADLKLHDTAYWMLTTSNTAPSGWELRNVPPSWVVGRYGGDLWGPEGYTLLPPTAQGKVKVPAENMLVFHGWNPIDPARGASPVEALRGLLIEQISAQAYRTQVWRRGGRVGTYITRPIGAPEMSPEARERFMRSYNAKYSGNDASEGGGTPLFHEGMELKQTRFTAKEEEWAEVAKLSLAMVASVYHVNPTMVGLLDNANYSNTKEFRKMLYGDTLGPDIAMLEDRINAMLVPRIAPGSDVYVEFNIDEKLQGNFEDQAKQLQSATGAPWMTRNEARAMRNMPAIDGGDELVIPLNVLVGGQASPQDSAPKQDVLQAAMLVMEAIGKSGSEPDTKEITAGPPAERDKWDEDLELALVAFFERQGRVLASTLGAKSADLVVAWDAERWNRELADDILIAARGVTGEVGAATTARLGIGADAYSVGRTSAFLASVAEARAASINNATFDHITRLAVEHGLLEAVALAIGEAAKDRAPATARTLVTSFESFATVEAAKQAAGDREGATKTWVVNSKNPRDTHVGMNGETVPLDDRFSNGMKWPGDWAGGAAEVVNCTCTVTVTIDI